MIHHDTKTYAYIYIEKMDRWIDGWMDRWMNRWMGLDWIGLID
jgi:hypothetical protein